jgi:hypothetical protein
LLKVEHFLLSSLENSRPKLNRILLLQIIKPFAK